MQKNKYEIKTAYYYDLKGRAYKRLSIIDHILIIQDIDNEALEDDSPGIRVTSTVKADYMPDPERFNTLSIGRELEENSKTKAILLEILELEETERPGAAPEIDYKYSTLLKERDNPAAYKIGRTALKAKDRAINRINSEQRLNEITDLYKKLELRKKEIIEQLRAKSLPDKNFQFLLSFDSDIQLLVKTIFQYPEQAADLIDPLLEPVLQENYSSLTSLSYPMAKIVRAPFKQNFTDKQLKDGKILFTDTLTLDAHVDLLMRLSLLINENLDFLDYLVLSAYYTAKKITPNFTGVTFLDLANAIHKTKTGKPLNSKDKFVDDVKKSALKLIRLTGQLDYRALIENQENKSEKLQKYLDAGGDAIIEFNYISAIRKPIIKRNGVILDGLVPNGNLQDDLFFQFIEMTGQIKTLSGNILINPLRAGKENDELLHYMAYRLSNMPYNDRNDKTRKVNFLNAKLEYLEKSKELGVKEASNLPEVKKAIEQQKALPNRAVTISVKTIVKDLKINLTRPKRLTDKIEKILNFWIESGIIENYTVNYKGQAIQSYTVKIF